MNTIQLECFLMVADCLNFTKAAESLKITQPAVSHQIRALEDELGVKLFILSLIHILPRLSGAAQGPIGQIRV